MNPTVGQAIKTFQAGANPSSAGTKSAAAALKKLQGRLTIPLPDWYVRMLSTCPLAGTCLDYPLYQPEGEYDGYESIRLATTESICSETEKCYPGFAIRNLGYTCLAIDPTGSGADSLAEFFNKAR